MAKGLYAFVERHRTIHPCFRGPTRVMSECRGRMMIRHGGGRAWTIDNGAEIVALSIEAPQACMRGPSEACQESQVLGSMVV